VSTSFADYLGLYNASWLRLQQQTPELLSYEDRALYSTWDISLDHVKKQSLPAFKLLQLWAYFDNQDVWFELLRECQQDGPEWFSQLMEDQLSFDKAVRVLCEHALVEANATPQDDRVESQGYSMHSCVHSWTKHVVNKVWDSNMARLVLCCVGLHVPDSNRPQYLGVEQRLVGHANQCQEYLVRRLAGQDDDVVMLNAIHRLGDLYVDQAKLDEAEEMYLRALAGSEKAFGRDHTSTLSTVNNLGLLYVDQGKLDKAEKMYQWALAGLEKAFGRDHTSTLSTVNNLGLLYVDQGRLDKAEKMCQWALVGLEKALGRDHTSTLSAVSNLGFLYVNQGRLNEAEEMYQRALAGKEKALGRDHTSTLNTVNNLGSLYVDQGKLDEAEKMYQWALAGLEKALGRDHTSTLDTVDNLGILYRRQGKLDEAKEMYQWALAGYEKHFGLEHVQCRHLRKSLASLENDIASRSKL
jgi:tetratricopeptide (TPR) repeat protein